MTRSWELSQVDSPLFNFTTGTESQKDSGEMPKTKEEEEAERLAAEEEAKRKAAEETSEEEEENEDFTVEEYKAKLAEKEARLREVNKEARDRRLALEKLEKEKKEREEAELSEKEKLEKRAAESEKTLADLQKEYRTLKLERKFETKARELKLEFVNEKAREDAFRLLDPEKVGEDFSGLEEELKALAKERPYYFGKPDPNQFINDGSKKSKSDSKTLTRKAIDQKKRRIAPL